MGLFSIFWQPQRPPVATKGERGDVPPPWGAWLAFGVALGTRVPTLSGETPKIECIPDRGSNPELPAFIDILGSLLNHSATRALNRLIHILHI